MNTLVSASQDPSLAHGRQLLGQQASSERRSRVAKHRIHSWALDHIYICTVIFIIESPSLVTALQSQTVGYLYFLGVLNFKK